MIVSRAPLRLSLGGGGTDLPSYSSRHGGFILAVAIDKYVRVCINRPAASGPAGAAVLPGRPAGLAGTGHDLLKPALEVTGITEELDVVSLSDVPPGTGLGSSGSYLVALLAGLWELNREPVSRWALADQAVYVEAGMAGRSVGVQDAYLAAFGGPVCLDIGRDGHVLTLPLAVSTATLERLRSRFLLFFTGICRTADSILDAQRTGSETDDPVMVDSLHETKEIGRRVKRALERGELDEFGALLHEHWLTKKRRSDLISNVRVDKWYNMARSAGALGGKLVGAGGGGFLAVYCPDGTKSAVCAALAAEGLRRLPYGFDAGGVKVVGNL